MSDGGCLPHFDGLLSLAEKMLDGGELVGGNCECLSAESVADEEAKILLCVEGFGTGDTEGTRGGWERKIRRQDVRVSGSKGVRYVRYVRVSFGGWERLRSGTMEDTPSIKSEYLALQTRFTVHTQETP